MQLDFIEFKPVVDLDGVAAWAASKGLPPPGLMQVHPENYPVKEVEWRIVFDMPNGRQEFFRFGDYIGLLADGRIHSIDWLDAEKNYEMTELPGAKP